jgi:hypothetical protein
VGRVRRFAKGAHTPFKWTNAAKADDVGRGGKKILILRVGTVYYCGGFPVQAVDFTLSPVNGRWFPRIR